MSWLDKSGHFSSCPCAKRAFPQCVSQSFQIRNGEDHHRCKAVVRRAQVKDALTDHPHSKRFVQVEMIDANASLVAEYVVRSVLQKRHLVATAFIVSPHTGHAFVSSVLWSASILGMAIGAEAELSNQRGRAGLSAGCGHEPTLPCQLQS
jgi:hypothetical protein